MYNPEEGASFLPGCCLSLLSFPSRSRKHCHPGLCCTPPAFLFLAQEWASSSPGQWPGPPSCSRAVGPGAVPRSWRPECTPLLCAVSSLEQQGLWRQPQEADCDSSTLESWVRAGRQGGKSHGLGTDHGPAITASFDPHTAWEGGRSRLSHQRQTGAPGATAALAGSYTGAQSGIAQDSPCLNISAPSP